jgi:RHS protein
MSQAVFQVSVQNDPPTAPFPLLPLDGETLYTATPTLQWLDSLDPEGASLTYQVEVYSDKHLTTLVASVSGLPGTLLTTSWQVTPALLDKTTYYWRVRGSDGALSSAWSGTQSFKVGKLTTGGTPRYFAAKPGGLNGRRVATIGSLGGLTGGETEAIFFYQTDHLGTPLMMTDQTGQVVWQAENLPFGELVTIELPPFSWTPRMEDNVLRGGVPCASARTLPRPSKPKPSACSNAARNPRPSWRGSWG